MQAAGPGPACAARGDLLASSLAQAVPQMPLIADLDRIGANPPANGFGIRAETIAADHFNTGGLPKRCLQGVSVAVRQHVHPPASLRIDQHQRAAAAARYQPHPAPAEPVSGCP